MWCACTDPNFTSHKLKHDNVLSPFWPVFSQISNQPVLMYAPTCKAGLAHGWWVAARGPCPVEGKHPESECKRRTASTAWLYMSGVIMRSLDDSSSSQRHFLKAYLLAVRSCWPVMTAKLLRTVLRLARTCRTETQDSMYKFSRYEINNLCALMKSQMTLQS